MINLCRRWVTLALIICFMFSTVCQAASFVLPLSRMGYDDLTLVGPTAATELTFPKPYGKVLPDSTVHLWVEPYAQLNAASTFSFFVNDRQVRTVTAGELKNQRLVKLPIPNDTAASNKINVSVRPNIFVTNDICTDYRRGQLFYQVGPQSNLFLNFAPSPIVTVADFFHNLYQGLVVVISDKPSLGEINAGVWAAGIMHKVFPYQSVQLIYSNEVYQYRDVPKLWIMTDDHLPPQLAPYAGQLAVAGSDVVIAAADAENLKNSVKQLASLPVLEGLATSNNVAVTASTAHSDGDGSLMAFGNNAAQTGIIAIPVDFSIYPALLNQAPQNMAVHLEGNYTASIAAGKSVRMDVYFNRNLIHSEQLDGSGTVKRDIPVPSVLPLLTRNVLGVEFHYPEENGICQFRGTQQSAQIQYTNYMKGMGEYPKDQYNWKNIGMTFGGQGYFVLEDMLSAEVVRSAAELVYFMNGQLPDGQFAFPEFKITRQYREIKSGAYLAYIGLAENIPEEMQEGVPLWRGKDYLLNRKNQEQVRYQYQSGSDAVIGQIGCYRDIPTMIITAGQAGQSLPAALKYLNQGKNSHQLEGNLFIYRANSPLLSLESRNQNMVAEVGDPTVPFWQKTVRNFTPWLVKLQHYGEKYGMYILAGILFALAVIFTKVILFIRADKSSFQYKGRHLPK